MSTALQSPALTRAVACERVVFALALWTVAVHVTVLAYGSLFDLFIVSVLLAVLGLALWRRWLRDGKRRPATEETRPAHRTQQRLFWLVAIVVVSLTLTAHRPDWDDALYLNVAASAADMPSEPIQQLDRQHALDLEVPIKRSSRLTSVGSLVAAISFLTGIPVIHLFHLVIPPLAALFVLLANRELFKILTPRHWAFGVLAVVVFLFVDGEIHRSYGNFSFVRLHQGKGIVLSAFVPLVIAYALEFALRPTRRGWLRLAAVQIAAVGFSSSALIVGPTVAALGLVTGVLHAGSPRRFLSLASGLLSSTYVGAMALWAQLPLVSAVLMHGGDFVPSPTVAVGDHVGLVWGDGHLKMLYGFVLLTAWIWAGTPLARKLCLVFPIVVCLVFLNPLFAGGIAKYAIPEAVYWRVLWLVPLPVMTALTLLAPLTTRRFDWNPRLRYGLLALMLAALPILSERTILSRENEVEMRWPGLKVPATYEVGTRVADLVEGRPNVLAPETVSPWFPTMHHHPYPLVSRSFYATRSRFGKELEDRLAIKRYIRSKRPMEPQRFRQQLEASRIACVVLDPSNQWHEEIRRTLATSDFEKVDELMNHEIWLRRTVPSSGRSAISR